MPAVLAFLALGATTMSARAEEQPAYYVPTPNEAPNPLVNPADARLVYGIWAAAPLSALVDVHSFVLGGPVRGTATETSLRVGLVLGGRRAVDHGGFGFHIGVLNPGKLFTMGFDVARDQGIIVHESGADTIAILVPFFDLKWVTSFKSDHLLTFGSSLSGLRYARCVGSTALRIDLRVPTFAAWLPLKVADEVGRPSSIFVFSSGVSLEGGVIF